MIYQKTTLCAMPKSCTVCSCMQETITITGGAETGHIFSCTKNFSILLDEKEAQIMRGARHADCPLVEFTTKDDFARIHHIHNKML